MASILIPEWVANWLRENGYATSWSEVILAAIKDYLNDGIQQHERELEGLYAFYLAVMQETVHCGCRGGDRTQTLANVRNIAAKANATIPPHIQKLYDRCCELEEHVAAHDLDEFEHCDICCENGEARKADIAYENACIAWVNSLCWHAGKGKMGKTSAEINMDAILAMADQVNSWKVITAELTEALKGMMAAYERRIRSDCKTDRELDAEPWRSHEFLFAEKVLTRIY